MEEYKKGIEMKNELKKNVSSSIKAIKYLEGEIAHKALLKKSPLNNSLAISKKSVDGGFTVKFFINKKEDGSYSKDPSKYGIYKNILLSRSNILYSINENSVTSISMTLGLPRVLTIGVKNFQSAEDKEFDNKSLRLIIPVEVEPSFEVFNSSGVRISGLGTVVGLIKAKINNKSYHVFKYKNTDLDKKYLIIDSLEDNLFDQFKSNTSAILLGFGLVTGNLHQGEYYYQIIRKDNPLFVDGTAYVKKESSIISNTCLFDPRRFKKYVEHYNRHDILEKHSIYLGEESFSKICQKIRDSETFARCIKLLLEGNQTKLLLLKGGIYSIALETLTNIIYEENEDKINPITDKKLAKEIRRGLKNELSKYDSSISDYGLKVLKSKIENINTPTNSKKLSKPFELCGLKLSKLDIEILNHRNKFLHGTSPFEEKELNDKQKDIKYISSKLFFLINILVLKYCGYEGHVINFGGLHQLNWEEEMTENLFEVI